MNKNVHLLHICSYSNRAPDDDFKHCLLILESAATEVSFATFQTKQPFGWAIE
jgi:hypothetical protein